MKSCITSVTLFLLAIVCIAPGCEKKTDEYGSDKLSDYVDMQVGKYILYQLDSTVFINFGQKDTVHTYYAKDVVDAEITDGLGRKSFRIIRYQRDTASSENSWVASLTYFVTPTREAIELSENNFRYVKLKLPVQEGYDWRGNGYLPANPYKDVFPFSNDEDIQEWNYVYENVNTPIDINSKNYDSTISVFQVGDSVNVPITFPDGIAYRNYWIEKYAKGIGLIYREMVMWEYQPPAGANAGYKQGFGLKMTILDHN